MGLPVITLYKLVIRLEMVRACQLDLFCCSDKAVVTVRNSSCRKVMLLQVFFCPQGYVYTPLDRPPLGRHQPPLGTHPLGRHQPPLGRHQPPLGTHPLGIHPSRQTPSPRRPLQRMVRILLECILVVLCFRH